MKGPVAIALSFFICAGALFGAEAACYRMKDRLILMESRTLVVVLNPANLATTIARKDRPEGEAPVSEAVADRKKYVVDLEARTIGYPREGLEIAFSLDEEALRMSFRSRKPQAIRWPSLSMAKEDTSLIWPHFEGSYVPLGDAAWTSYLESRGWDTTQALYMPFWGVERGKRLLSYIVENPFHNTISFSEKRGAMRMDFSHAFTDNADLTEPMAFSVHLDADASPIAPAKHFRRYLKDRHGFATLEEKMRIAPRIRRFVGAPHAYIWDGAPITRADIDAEAWIPLAKAIVDQAASKEPSAGRRIMGASPAKRGSIEEMARQSVPSPYLRGAMADSLSEALRSPGLFSEALWPLATLPRGLRGIAERLLAGEVLPVRELVRLNGYLIHSSFPEYLHEPSTWGNGVSTRMIDALAESGMDRFVLTCDGVEKIDARPGIASYAEERGYLIGPYDGYDSVHDPDAPEWPTALFDRPLYETGGIVRADGSAVKGFLDVGYSLSPKAAMPYFEKRVAANFREVPYSYYFLDCDAFGAFLDDYRPGRIVSQSENAALLVDQVTSVFEKYKVPVGSEGGSYLFAGSLALAEGVFFPVICGDPDLETNEMSRYFLGRPLPADEPEKFFMPAMMKDGYARLFSDPRFRLPLYEAVFHDSLVTTSHWSSSSLKFTNIAETTALTEILYQVAPMYHFNLSYFEKIKGRIKPHVEVFERTHSYSYRYPLEEFEYLTEDRSVQRTRFGDLVLIANFREGDYAAEGRTIPARSLLIAFRDTGESFIYRSSAPSDDPRLAREVPALIEDLRDEEWEVRMAAARALANMEGEGAQAVPALTRVLKDKEWQVRRPAAYALGAIGKKAKAAAPSLIEALGDEEWQVRRAAASALGSIGADTRSARRALEARLGDPELQVRIAAKASLESLREGRWAWWRSFISPRR